MRRIKLIQTEQPKRVKNNYFHHEYHFVHEKQQNHPKKRLPFPIHLCISQLRRFSEIRPKKNHLPGANVYIILILTCSRSEENRSISIKRRRMESPINNCTIENFPCLFSDATIRENSKVKRFGSKTTVERQLSVAIKNMGRLVEVFAKFSFRMIEKLIRLSNDI